MQGLIRSLLAIGCAGLLAATVGAQALDRDTMLHVDSPVQVPGAVLDSGEYLMKLHPVDANRHTVQIFDRNETDMVIEFQAISSERTEAVEQAEFEFERRGPGEPAAIKSWYDHGARLGLEFVYPEDQDQIVQEWREERGDREAAEADPPARTEAMTPRADAERDAEPRGLAEPQRPEHREPFGQEPEARTPALEPERDPFDDRPTAQLQPGQQPGDRPLDQQQVQPGQRTLPTTASAVPLAGLIGLAALGLGVGLRAMSRTWIR